MQEKKKHVKALKKVIVICVLISIISFVTVFGRYMLNRYRDFYTRTKEFYFNSDKLSEDEPEYRIENWPGIDYYDLTINMNSRGNEKLVATYDIEYEIEFVYSDNVTCTINKPSTINNVTRKGIATGTIYSNTNQDAFELTITPVRCIVARRHSNH